MRKRARVVEPAAASTSSAVPGPSTSSPPPLYKWPAVSVDERSTSFRRNAPVLYDALVHHGMQWGSLSVAWGEPVRSKEEAVVLGEVYSEEFHTEQTLYFSGRTDGVYDEASRSWRGQPAEIFACRAALPKLRCTRRTSLKFQDHHRSSKIAVVKRLLHPGEVNRMRSFGKAPHLVVTHTDASTVFAWDFSKQPHRPGPPGESSSTSGSGASLAGSKKLSKSDAAMQSIPCSVPDVELVGHTDALKYALDASTTGTRVLSGASNGRVLCWDLNDLQSSTGEKSKFGTPTLNAMAEFKTTKNGHSGAVEDCCFKPSPAGPPEEACSVGTDKSLLVWDLRSSSREGPSARVLDAHTDDVNCCAWSPFEARTILTGGSDRVVHAWDLRKAKTPILTVPHSSSVINVRWSPHLSGIFATTDEENWLTIFRVPGEGEAADLEDPAASAGACRVFFQHMGHRTSVVDLAWNPWAEWWMASVSDDSQDESRGGGGTLQLWRPSEFITGQPSNDPEWLQELEDALSTKEASVLNEEEAA